MQTQNSGQTKLAALQTSRRTLFKGSIALGAVAIPSTPAVKRRSATASAVIPVEARVLAEWKINNPSGVFIGFGSVWVPGHHDLTTTRIDPATNKVVAVIEGTGFRSDSALAVGEVMWVSGQSDDTTWIAPDTNAVSTTMSPVPGSLLGLVFGFGSLWASTPDYKICRIDPTTGEIIATIAYAPGSAYCNSGLYASSTAIWVNYCDGLEWIKIDPASNTIASRTPHSTLIEHAQAQTVVPEGKGTEFLWVPVGSDANPAMLRIDPTTGLGLTFLQLTPDQMMGNWAVADDAVWLGGINQINRVDVPTNRINATYKTDDGRSNLFSGFSSIWRLDYENNLVQRLDITP